MSDNIIIDAEVAIETLNDAVMALRVKDALITKYSEELEENVEKIAEYENDIDTIKNILHEVGGCDGEKGYAKGWDEAVNEIERQMLENLANYNKDT